MKVLTSFSKLTTGEGTRIAYTYSTIGEGGVIESQNDRGNFIVVDKEVLKHLSAIEKYIEENHLS